MASSTNSVSSGWTASRMLAAWRISSSSMPRRPAVSTMTMSYCLLRASATPPRATSTGSAAVMPSGFSPPPTEVPGCGAKTGTPARSPTTWSWVTAPGRCRSQATSKG
ncbi:Uncharacterised protein [Mycobacteroides abscessus subsp. abscessus]|nr:Uncharacterised protein [Mycobacteroides abscessus subsp. abscessus]